MGVEVVGEDGERVGWGEGAGRRAGDEVAAARLGGGSGEELVEELRLHLFDVLREIDEKGRAGAAEGRSGLGGMVGAGRSAFFRGDGRRGGREWRRRGSLRACMRNCRLSCDSCSSSGSEEPARAPARGGASLLDKLYPEPCRRRGGGAPALRERAQWPHCARSGADPRRAGPLRARHEVAQADGRLVEACGHDRCAASPCGSAQSMLACAMGAGWLVETRRE